MVHITIVVISIRILQIPCEPNIMNAIDAFEGGGWLEFT
jgi:hypothetical protein